MQTPSPNPAHLNQLKMVYDYLYLRPATASMVAKATGVPQKNICRYKRDLQQQGQLAELLKARCKVTGLKAWYLTTNPTLFNATRQLSLF